jgi:hypothetical protein
MVDNTALTMEEMNQIIEEIFFGLEALFAFALLVGAAIEFARWLAGRGKDADRRANNVKDRRRTIYVPPEQD